MKADCHIHMVLDGVDWKQAIARHSQIPDDNFIKNTLQLYRQQGYTYLRDGGDRWGAGLRARQLAAQYGITYRTPGAPLCQKGHYGSFIGTTYESIKEYACLVAQARESGADFIKIMISGLVDFNRYGVLTEEGLPAQTIQELVHIAHQEGMAVMAHANGTETVLPAAVAGVDSVEHGTYLHQEALCAMQQNGTVWVPTLSTVGNLRGQGRFDETAVGQILESQLSAVSCFAAMGGLVAAGTDAGAWRVPHGSETELPLLQQAGVSLKTVETANQRIIEKF